MKNSAVLKENSSDQKTTESNIERSESREETNRCGKNCQIAIFCVIWVAICIPTNIIAAIFFFKTKNLDFSQIGDSSNINLDSLDEFQNISEEHRINASADWEEEVKEQDLDHDISHSSSLYPSQNKTMETKLFNCYEKIHELKDIRKALWYWLEGVFLFVFGTIGLVMNILAIIILKYCPDNTSFSLLLIYLAVWDTALIVDMMMDKLLSYHFEYPTWFNITYPFFWHPVKGVCLSATIFMIVAVSIERYRSICYPFAARKSPHWYAGVVFISAFLLKLPRFFHFELDETGNDYHPSKMFEDLNYIKITAYWDDLIITGILPIITVAFLNLQTYLNIKKSLRLKKLRMSTRRCGLRANRPRILHERSSQSTTDTSGNSFDRERIPIVALNGRIIVTESFERDQQKEAHRPKRLNLQKGFTEEKNCLEIPKNQKKNNYPSFKNELLEEEASRTISARKVYLQKKIRNNLEPPTKENTRLVLLAIVILFILTHSFRLAFKIYEVLLPRGNTKEHFIHCFNLGRHHVPFVLYILLLLNNLFVVFNSSVNFIVYCCVSKSFRNRTLCMIRSKLSSKDNSYL